MAKKSYIERRKDWYKGHVPETIVMAVLAFAGLLYWLLPPFSREYQPTEAVIKDSVRHYPPVMRGDKLHISCIIKNQGEHSMVITDIQPDNFSIEQTSVDPKIIPAGDSAAVSFVYTADKLVGAVEHHIDFYGNIKETGHLRLTFGTHVVRPSGDESDYEDIYFNEKQKTIERLIDGDMGEQGYTTD